MNLIIPLERLVDYHPRQVGGKAFSLGVIFRRGIMVPRTLCITQDVYEMYVRSTGLMERISLELGRRDFPGMHWEELWDASLRIRSMFLNTAIPPALVKKIRDPIEDHFGDGPVAVRSSAPGEDSTAASFAGLHESYVNVRGIYSILDHIRLVWASLWSDEALLYRQELGLDVHHSTMAVIIQELIAGQKSGSASSLAQADQGQTVVEAIYGLNQGVFEGMAVPDRWILERTTGSIITHTTPHRLKIMCPSASGVSLSDLAPDFHQIPPLSEEEVKKVFSLAIKMEEIFGSPQHVEWTFANSELYTLQVRPITEPSSRSSVHERNWYYSLERSLANLKQLKKRIEEELIPEMMKEAAALPKPDLSSLSGHELSDLILDMDKTYSAWERAYWKYFIPFAHGMRLFGRVYNDTLRPHDPFEFMELLMSPSLLSVERNVELEKLASKVKKSPSLAFALNEGRDTSGFVDFEQEISRFIDRFGDLACYSPHCGREGEVVRGLVLKLAGRPDALRRHHNASMEDLEEYYLDFFPEERKVLARELLNLAREGYRLRDDDNIYLGKIKGRLRAAFDEGRRRLAGRLPFIRNEDIPRALTDPGFRPSHEEVKAGKSSRCPYELHMRQLLGQPAVEGIATGAARVLLRERDLSDFKAGEILVCDALDPDMTFIMPLASGIVERSGGMVIHGTIMAREYGLPCVIGVPGAVDHIKTGDSVTVDGYLGIVILNDQCSL